MHNFHIIPNFFFVFLSKEFFFQSLKTIVKHNQIKFQQKFTSWFGLEILIIKIISPPPPKKMAYFDILAFKNEFLTE